MNRTEKLLAAVVLTQIAFGTWTALTLRTIQRAVDYTPDYESELDDVAEKLDAIAGSTASIDERLMAPGEWLRKKHPGLLPPAPVDPTTWNDPRN